MRALPFLLLIIFLATVGSRSVVILQVPFRVMNLKKKKPFLLGFLTLEVGTDRLSLNVDKELPLLAAQ